MTDTQDKIDGIFDDLIVGHNFEYAKAATEKLVLEARIEEHDLVMNEWGTRGESSFSVWSDDRIRKLKAKLGDK